MVQAWYQGGISVFDWTDASKPKEIAYFDRGPMDATKLVMAGSWSAYWYNGYMVSSEIARGLDILELTPSGWLSQNELDAAKTVRFDYLNAQEQPKIVWPASFPLVGAPISTSSRAIERPPVDANHRRADRAGRAEKLGRQQRQTALLQLATQLTQDAAGAADQAKVQMLAAAVKDLASAQR